MAFCSLLFPEYKIFGYFLLFSSKFHPYFFMDFKYFLNKTMVEGDQELFSTLMRIFYTECGHKDVERAYTKMSWSLLRLD